MDVVLVFLITIGWAHSMESMKLKWYIAAIGCVLSLPVIHLFTIGLANISEINFAFNPSTFLMALIQLPFALCLFYIIARHEQSIVKWCLAVILSAVVIFFFVPFLASQLGIYSSSVL